jgi:peroxiredoxin
MNTFRPLAALCASAILAVTLIAAIPTASAPAEAKKKAPEFSLPSAAGKTHALSEFKGKWVVLEWWNHQCPFVVKHYKEGNMQSLKDKMTKGGVVWLTINSSAPGKQGHVSAAKATELMAQMKSKPTAVLLDHDGKVGRSFQAKVTPHMFLINPEGYIEYEGAIDSVRSTNPADIAGATNYLMAAYTEAKAGKPVTTPKTQPYGCSVKYSD